MKKLVSLALTSTALLFAAPLFAQSEHEASPAPKAKAPAPVGKLMPVTEKEAAWAAKERKTYPLDVCVASDEKLGGMGKAPEFIYRVAGQPDRLVLFCCSGCEDDFMKDPAKHVAKLDAAAQAKK